MLKAQAENQEAKKPRTIFIPEPRYEHIRVEIVFDTPLLQSQMSADTLDRPKVTAEEAFERARHVVDAKRRLFGHPAVAFWHSMIDASSLISGDGKRNKAIGKAFNIYGDGKEPLAALVDVKGKPLVPVMHSRIAINAQSRSAVVAYAAAYHSAHTHLLIEYDADRILRADVLRLLARAGTAIGVGTWRVTCKGGGRGSFGSFHIGKVEDLT